jgi:hypothetical protein
MDLVNSLPFPPQMCKYGRDCYQKNPMHTEKFKHPQDDDDDDKDVKAKNGNGSASNDSVDKESCHFDVLGN